MLLSSKRKFSKIEKTESTTPEMKRSRVSQTSNLSALHLDENIPQNMQKGSADHSPEVKKLANTDLIESPKDFEYQKPLRRSRLNLKKVKSGNQARDPEDQKESERKTELHLRSKHGPTVFLKEYLKKIGDQVDADTFDGNDEESDLKCTRKHELTDIQCCPVCRSDVSLFESDIELNKHVNNCLDNLNVDSTSSRKTSTTSDYKEVYFCQICGKDMNRYSTIQRQQHLNRCCDNTEQVQNQATTSPKQLACLICGKIIKTFKSRQSHMKSCAKKNNVSTTQLVELNRHEKTDKQSCNTGSKKSISDPVCVNADDGKPKLTVFRSSKRKKNTKFQAKNLDEETQVALALSASLQLNAKDTKYLEKRVGKKHRGQTELPALLLRSDDEMKKVTEARAASVLCHWADSDEEIQCTPALAPSSLLDKYGTNCKAGVHSSDAVDQLETISEHTEPECEDSKELNGKYENGDIKVCKANLERENEDAMLDKPALEMTDEPVNSLKIPPVVTSAAKDDGEERYLTVDKHARLWRVASLSAENMLEFGFYVPNLLPKTIPRKKKVVVKSNSQASEERECCEVITGKVNAKQNSPLKPSGGNSGITESQEIDIQLLAELVGEDRSDDIQSDLNEIEDSGECEQTCYPSSGFCVAKDVHTQVDKKNENVHHLLNDLSRMVGNPLLSDVEIVAKDKQRFFAHSFMLATRCNTLAKMLREEKSSNSVDERNKDFTTLEMVDIDIRAVHAVMTYIYTSSFVSVHPSVMEDIKILVER